MQDLWLHLGDKACPGKVLWMAPDNCFKPWVKMAMQQDVVLGAKVIHGSHSLSYYRVLVYYTECGYHTSGGSLVRLAEPCGVNGVRASALASLRHIKQGHPPGGRWPLPDEWQAPAGLMTFIIRDDYADLSSFRFRR